MAFYTSLVPCLLSSLLQLSVEPFIHMPWGERLPRALAQALSCGDPPTGHLEHPSALAGGSPGLPAQLQEVDGSTPLFSHRLNACL